MASRAALDATSRAACTAFSISSDLSVSRDMECRYEAGIRSEFPGELGAGQTWRSVDWGGRQGSRTDDPRDRPFAQCSRSTAQCLTVFPGFSTTLVYSFCLSLKFL